MPRSILFLVLLMLSPALVADESAWLDRAFASTRCPARGATVERFAEAMEGKCLQISTRLHVLGALSLNRVRYSARLDPTNPASPVVVTEALFEEQNSTGRVRPLWLTQLSLNEGDIARVLPQRYRGWRLVELMRCARGAGGCSQELVVWRPGSGIDAIPSFRPAFEAELPEGHTLRNAPVLDFDKLQVEGSAWSVSGTNSRSPLLIVCKARFDGTAVSLRGCKRDRKD